MTTYKVKTPSGWVYIDNQNYDARYILASSKGSNNGVASLDESGHVIFDQLPSSITGAVNYRGVFDPTEGAPSPAAAGYYYVSSGVGTISATSFSTGDWLVYTDGSSWNKIANSSASVTWNNVSNKPDVYTPDTHDNDSHSESYITTLGVTYEALANNNDVGDSANQVASGVHTHSGYQPLDGDLTAISALSGNSGLLKKTAANTWTLDTNNYLTELSTVANATNWDGQALPSITGNALKFIRLNEAGTAFEFATASSGGGTWGSITGTLSDQTDLDTALGGKVPTTRTVNSKALSSDISLTPADVGAQPADATLTALAGVTTAANKLPYATGEDAFSVCDFTPLGRSLIGTTTSSAVRDLIAAASSTTATQSIYVDKAATGAGTGVDWTNAFTTITAAINSLPAIINHEVTIYVRKGATPYQETVTVQRVIAGGSVTIRGEYYWSNQAASNSTANRLVKDASDDFTNVEVGDRVSLIRYSGTYDDSYPSGGFYGTITDVSNKASGYVTISMDSSVTPTTGWRYIITKTEIDASDDGFTPLRDYCIDAQSPCYVRGFTLSNPKSFAFYTNQLVSGLVTVSHINIIAGAKSGIFATNSTATSFNLSYFSVVRTASRGGFGIYAGRGSCAAKWGIVIGMSYGSGVGHLFIHTRATVFCSCIIVRSLASDDGHGVSLCAKSHAELQRFSVYGASSAAKLATGLSATQSSTCIPSVANIDATTVTTAKTPANWAATTDGSFIP